MKVEAGHIYIAPGGYHMTVKGPVTEPTLLINSDPPENFCRPAVDPMFRSLATVFGASTLALVLTGMGADGAKGGDVIAKSGGSVIAQDEATSVVWGMPGAAATIGCCSELLPLADIGQRVTEIVRGDVR